MIKIVLLMYMCSTTIGNKCQIIPTPIQEFKDVFECTKHGYIYSSDIMATLKREFVNKYGAHTKFTCEEQKII